ncbi:hypothetical protein DFH27DRAFT_616993 [Peziza echinospora]|nr:hypothetical protein DFH27DRAFT_616993 [Peziza echinospora]
MEDVGWGIFVRDTHLWPRTYLEQSAPHANAALHGLRELHRVFLGPVSHGLGAAIEKQRASKQRAELSIRRVLRQDTEPWASSSDGNTQDDDDDGDGDDDQNETAGMAVDVSGILVVFPSTIIEVGHGLPRCTTTGCADHLILASGNIKSEIVILINDNPAVLALPPPPLLFHAYNDQGHDYDNIEQSTLPCLRNSDNEDYKFIATAIGKQYTLPPWTPSSNAEDAENLHQPSPPSWNNCTRTCASVGQVSRSSEQMGWLGNEIEAPMYRFYSGIPSAAEDLE